MNKFFHRRSYVTAFIISSGLSSFGQPNVRSLKTADYPRAERFMGYNTAQLVDRASVRPQWLLPGDRFWYLVLTAQGSEFILVDPASGKKVPAFDQQKLAAALSASSVHQYDPFHLDGRQSAAV